MVADIYEDMIRLTQSQISAFRQVVYTYFEGNSRDLPWRHTHEPYYILVSEVMLQQTQVCRVVDTYKHFIIRFPTLESLAQAPIQEVLSVWQGLGYNRRALLLRQVARTVVEKHKGVIPQTREELQSLPGIGAVIRLLVEKHHLSEFSLLRAVTCQESQLKGILERLEKEGFIRRTGKSIILR